MRIIKGVLFALGTALLCGTLSPGVNADDWDKKTVVTFAEPIEISGHILPAGTYVFKLVNNESDRHIVQVWNADQSQVLATIMAIAAYRLEPADRTVLNFDERPSGSPQALRTWFYPGDNVGQEFVYSYGR